MKDIYWKGHTILLLISLLCCFPDFVYAYSLRQFSNKNGLSNSAIQSLYQDSQGVLWIGTCDGLNVFDGNNIHLYTPVDVSRNLLSGNIISQIVESEPGILWLQTNYGLDRLDTYRQTCRTFTEFKDNIFLARSKNKCMLVLKDDGNLYHYQQENQKFLQLNISSMDFNKVLSMTIDSNNLLWIFATGNNTRCYRLNHTGKSVTLIPEKPFGHHGLKHAFIGEDSAYFIDETYALYEYSFSNRQCYYIADLKDEIEKRGEVSSIIKRENDFCIGFKSSGLIVLKYEANQKIKYRIEYTEIQSGIFCLMKDKFQDIVWVATDGEGLYMLYNDTFTMTNTLLNTPAYQVNNPVRSLYLDPQQTLWIGTKGSGILRIPNYLVNNTPEKHDRLITGNSTLTDNSVYCFAPGGKDRLWIGTENGINYYSYSTHQLKELAVQANGTKVKYVHSIDQTNDSTLWISTVGEGIVKVTLENQRKDPIVKHATRTLVSNGHMASNYFSPPTVKAALRCGSGTEGSEPTALMYVLENGTVPLQQLGKQPNRQRCVRHTQKRARLLAGHWIRASPLLLKRRRKPRQHQCKALHQQHRTWYLGGQPRQSLGEYQSRINETQSPRTDQADLQQRKRTGRDRI